jgi:hypothetical protein
MEVFRGVIAAASLKAALALDLRLALEKEFSAA